jgi:hypothetical protein
MAKKVLKKAQTGTYITTKSGRVGRTHGVYGPYESMDTTGYGKGKEEFELKTTYGPKSNSSTTIKRKDVPAKIEEFKKGATGRAKLKTGGMIKRADGSMSKRGLWDNLRSKAAQNKKTGAKPKAPTKAMLSQEKKIKSKGK